MNIGLSILYLGLCTARNIPTGTGIYGSHFEGDIAVKNPGSKPRGNILGAFVSNKQLRWSKTVQFSIGEDLNEYRGLIIDSLQWIAKKSCLTFVEGSTGDHIKFSSFGDNFNSGKGCWSYFGRQGGQQVVNLEIPDCLDSATVYHEVLHALGKVHEQSRPDRDNHVKINFENIEEADKHNFEIQKNTDVAGTSYDILSVMHYSPYAFSKNGLPTIEAFGVTSQNFGETTEPTETDLYELNVAYGCKSGEDYGEDNYEDNFDTSGYDYEENPITTLVNDSFVGLYEDYDNVYADFFNDTIFVINEY